MSPVRIGSTNLAFIPLPMLSHDPHSRFLALQLTPSSTAVFHLCPDRYLDDPMTPAFGHLFPPSNHPGHPSRWLRSPGQTEAIEGRKPLERSTGKAGEEAIRLMSDSFSMLLVIVIGPLKCQEEAESGF